MQLVNFPMNLKQGGECFPLLNMTECSCVAVYTIQLLPNTTVQRAGGSVWGFRAATGTA